MFKSRKRSLSSIPVEEIPAPLEAEGDVEIAPLPPELRVVGLFGEVSEKKAEELIYSLLLLANDGPEDIEIYVSSQGGAAIDMFAIYDVMRLIREKVDISTIGIGKTMSAAVMLLASGTKGKRKIGKYCRVMLHSVIAGNHGTLHDLDNEMKEIKYTQEKYIEVLHKETKLTKKQIKEIFSKNVNTYLSAEEAVEYGIVDEIV